jgi:hypothetical protein
MAALANAIVSRLGRIIGLYGQSYTYKRGASTTSVPARLSVMNNTTKYAWFTSAEVAAWGGLPGYVVTIAGNFAPFSSAPVAGDLITIKGVDHTVRKFDQPRLGTVVVKTVLYVSR